MDEDGNSSSKPESGVGHYKVIVAIGIMGPGDDVARFSALWITDSERRAHKINDRIFHGSLQLLPLPEGEVVIGE